MSRERQKGPRPTRKGANAEARAAIKRRRQDHTSEPRKMEKHRVVSRRRMMGTVAGAVGVLALGGGVLFELLHSGQSHTGNEIPGTSLEYTADFSFAKDFRYDSLPTPLDFLETINSLPESNIKKLLTDRVVPYFGGFSPDAIVRAGVKITVSSPQINVSERTIGIFGHSSFENRGADRVTIVENQTTKVPYADMLRSREYKTWRGKFKDGTPSLVFHWRKDHTMRDNIMPDIDMSVVSPEVVNGSSDTARQKYIKSVAFTFLKEACTLLIDDLGFEYMAQEMQDQGVSPYVKVNKGGKIQNVPALPQIDVILSNSLGRYINAKDKAGVVLALKAVIMGNMIPDFLRDNPLVTENVIYRVHSIDTSGSPLEIYHNAMRWGTTPASDQLASGRVIGNRNKLP